MIYAIEADEGNMRDQVAFGPAPSNAGISSFGDQMMPGKQDVWDEFAERHHDDGRIGCRSEDAPRRNNDHASFLYHFGLDVSGEVAHHDRPRWRHGQESHASVIAATDCSLVAAM